MLGGFFGTWFHIAGLVVPCTCRVSPWALTLPQQGGVGGLGWNLLSEERDTALRVEEVLHLGGGGGGGGRGGGGGEGGEEGSEEGVKSGCLLENSEMSQLTQQFSTQ